MNKLSEAQRRVLEAMADGRKACVYLPVRGNNESAFLYHMPKDRYPIELPKIRPVTISALQKLGYVEVVKHTYHSNDYAITEAGRAALQQRGGVEGKDAQTE